jgi:hypothetical protein
LFTKNLLIAGFFSHPKSAVSLFDFLRPMLVLEATEMKIKNDNTRELIHSFRNQGAGIPHRT